MTLQGANATPPPLPNLLMGQHLGRKLSWLGGVGTDWDTKCVAKQAGGTQVLFGGSEVGCLAVTRTAGARWPSISVLASEL